MTVGICSAGMSNSSASDAPSEATPRRDRLRPSIALALMAGFGTLVGLGVAATLTLGLWTASQNTRALLADKATLANETLVGILQRHLDSARDGNTYLADLIVRGEIDTADLVQFSDYLTAAMAAAPHILGMGFVAADGDVIRVSRAGNRFGIRLINAAQDPRMKVVLAEGRERQRPYWGELVWIDDPGATLINLRTPIRRNGRFLGVLTTAVSVAELSRALAQGPLQDLIPDRFILYGKDRVLAHRAMAGGDFARSGDVPLPSLRQIGDPVLASIWSEDARERVLTSLKGPTKGHTNRHGDKFYPFFYRAIEGYGPKPLIVGAYVRPGPERDREVNRIIYAASAGGAILVGSVLLALFVGRRISRPVRRLAIAARGVGSMEIADLPTLPRSIFRELDDAAGAFSDMRAALKWFGTYVPRKLVARLVAQGEGARVESEERRITVLFTDIVGFTSLSEKLSAGDTARLLNEHFSLLATCVDSEGGIIDKYIGDSLMAFWGPPLGEADHAEGACRAAIAMRDTMRRFNERRRTLGAPPLRIRVGIHTGRAIVGNIGAPGRTDFTVVGDTVNIAQRLEQMAKTVTVDDSERDAIVLLSADVVNELDGPYALISLGVRDIPGRDEGLMVFQLK